MRVGDLKEMLERYSDEDEVVIIQQPSYPLQSEVLGVVSAEEIAEAEGEGDPDEGQAERGTVYIAAGSATEYGPRAVYRNVG